MTLDRGPPPTPLLLRLQEIAAQHCNRCGHCCVESDPITVLDQDVRRIAKHLGIRPREMKDKYIYWDSRHQMALKSPCPFFNKKEDSSSECLIYEARPLVCRNFPFLSAYARMEMVDHDRLHVNGFCYASTMAVEVLKKKLRDEGHL